MKTLIVGGNGQIGNELADQLFKLGHEIETFGSDELRSSFTQKLIGVDVVFIAISTKDKGEIALAYILDALDHGKLVITCEKGALAYHFDMLRPHLSRIGYSATVGGGSRLLSLLDFPYLGLNHIFGVINGTLNYILSKVAEGTDPYVALPKAQNLGLCEPGASTLEKVYMAERFDTLLKLVILTNLAGVLIETLHISEFQLPVVSEKQLVEEITLWPKRYAVSIGKKSMIPNADAVVKKGEWFVEMGLIDTTQTPFTNVPVGRQNTLLIDDFGGVTEITGQGAGPQTTAASMVMDLHKFFKY